ncbi:hypothetical protein SAMN05446037_100692 [Anaerovirgula multivorans]|uniref:Uncharacterized protein n=1 Tax=Anaerovirgula multivorans TaxID=312168 RepID=A0A239CQQ0_9FIRM|nr:hypothetical protein [Anaerovirgula multivorans]SNS22239.1 hypothetical protein SAMN05446037_100692 [Anaerovirgula multivorans]
MAGQFTRLQKTYQIEDTDGVKLYTGVVHSGENKCKKPTADNEIPLGVIDNDERANDSAFSAGGSQTNRNVAVKLEGIASIKASGVIPAMSRVILGAGGVAKAIPSDAGTYNVLGFAEKAAEDGDVIPVRMAYHVITI